MHTQCLRQSWNCSCFHTSVHAPIAILAYYLPVLLLFCTSALPWQIFTTVSLGTLQSFYALLSKLSPNKISQSLIQFFRNTCICLADLILTQLLISTWMLLHLLLYHYQGCAPSLESSSVPLKLWIPSKWCKMVHTPWGRQAEATYWVSRDSQEAAYKPWACSFPVQLLCWILAPKTLFDLCVHEP